MGLFVCSPSEGVAHKTELHFVDQDLLLPFLNDSSSECITYVVAMGMRLLLLESHLHVY